MLMNHSGYSIKTKRETFSLGLFTVIILPNHVTRIQSLKSDQEIYSMMYTQG